MTKIKQRNELSIFEDFRIKQKINVGKNCIIGMGKIIKKNIKDFKILK